MTIQNSEKDKKLSIFGYYKQVFTKFSVYLPLLIAVILFTIAILLDDNKVFANLYSAGVSDCIYILSLCALLLFAVVSTILFFLNTKKIIFIDSLLVSLILFALAFIVHTLITHSSNTSALITYSVCFFVLVFSVLCAFCRVKILQKPIKESKILFTMSTFKTYYLSIFRKFSFMLPVLLSIVIAIVVYLFIDNNIIEKLQIFLATTPNGVDGTVLTVVLIVFVALFLLYASVDSTSKTLKVFDLILTTITFACPLIAFQMLVFSYSPEFLISCIGVLLFSVFFSVIRVTNVNLVLEEKSKITFTSGNLQKGFKAYYAELFSKNSFFLALTTSALITATILLAIFTDFIKSALTVTGDYLRSSSLGVLCVLALITISCMIFIMISSKNKRVFFADYLLFILMVTDVFSATALYYKLEIWTFIVFAFTFMFCVTLSITRVKHVEIYDGKDITGTLNAEK